MDLTLHNLEQTVLSWYVFLSLRRVPEPPGCSGGVARWLSWQRVGLAWRPTPRTGLLSEHPECLKGLVLHEVLAISWKLAWVVSWFVLFIGEDHVLIHLVSVLSYAVLEVSISAVHHCVCVHMWCHINGANAFLYLGWECGKRLKHRAQMQTWGPAAWFADDL